MYRWLLPLFLFLATCSRPQVPKQPTITYHADATFTERERFWIAQAVLRLSPYVSIVVRYDLGDGHHLRRATSLDPYIAGVDMQFNGKVYGVTTQFRDIYLIADRLTDDRTFLHTCVHEMIHGVGGEHVTDESAVMYENSDPRHLAVELNDSDLRELRREHK